MKNQCAPAQRAGLTAGVAAILALGASPPGWTQPADLEIRILSSGPDLVSGGDALVEVLTPAGARPGDITLALNGKDVTSLLEPAGGANRLRGVVAGMDLGANRLRASLKGTRRSEATLTVTNHPITGPILSGPHLTPYECNTAQSGLGEPLDANCSARRTIWHFYRATDGTFKALADPAGPRPSDLSTTTTVDGKSVPYIVRVDSGTINRAIYQLAILEDPKGPADDARWTPSAGWNRRLVVSFGGGSGTQYVQGAMTPPRPGPGAGPLNHEALSKGFAYLISSELVNGRRGNGVLQGETLMMLKEYFIERYGPPGWTSGSGGSGGAIQQLVITQMYPGLLDGLMPSLSFPDSSLHTLDSILLTALWPKLDPAVWTDAKKTAVEGFTPGTAAAWNRAYGRLGVPTNAAGCALSNTALVYDAVTNPKGARCTTQDIRVNIYGRDPKTGFARRPTDNVGVEYGLHTLKRGAISVDEFLELNEKVGGTDIDGQVVPRRAEGDAVAIRAAYESGLKASYGAPLGNVPIILSRVYSDNRGDIHDRQRDFVIRARLQKALGRTDHTVIWVSGRAGAYSTLDTMTAWLDAIGADPAPLSTDKVVRHKPADAVDACWDETGKKIVEPARFEGSGACHTLYPVHSEPRLVAGAPLANDILKCQLKPIDFAAYGVPFTDAQKSKMRAVFPSGVCDYSRPGVGQVPIKGTYQRY